MIVYAVIILTIVTLPIVILCDCWENGKSIKENFKRVTRNKYNGY